MALDTAAKRGSLIYRLLPFPSGAITQEDRQDLIEIFATPPVDVNPWTDQSNVITIWTDQ